MQLPETWLQNWQQTNSKKYASSGRGSFIPSFPTTVLVGTAYPKRLVHSCLDDYWPTTSTCCTFSCLSVHVVIHSLLSFSLPNRSPSFLEYCSAKLKHLEKSSLTFFKFVVCNPCQSSPSSTILDPLWFIMISLVFLCRRKLLFSGFLQFKVNFVRGQNN